MPVQSDLLLGRPGREGGAARFLQDNHGSIAIIAAVALPALILVAGGAVDYARSLSMRTKLQAAVDGALLATVEHKRSKPKASGAQLGRYFHNHLRASLPNNSARNVRAMRYNIGCRNGRMHARVQFGVPTYFLRFIGMYHLNVAVEAAVASGVCPGGERYRPPLLEVALVMDTSRNMEGGNIRRMKHVAKQIVRYVDRRFRGRARVAIVPFAQYVNVGKKYRNASWIDVPPDRPPVWHCRRRCIAWDTKSDGGGQGPRTCKKYRRYCFIDRFMRHARTWQGCVGSRNPDGNLTDANYGRQPVPGVRSFETVKLGKWYANYCGKSPITPLKLLRHGKDSVIAAIDRLQTQSQPYSKHDVNKNITYHYPRGAGPAYIPSGLVWGWRVLSSRPPFSEAARDLAVRKGKAHKVIILMTAAKNDAAPLRGPWARDSGSENYKYYKVHASSHVAYADDVLLKLCNNIKATNSATGRRNAEIIAVTFGADYEGEALMRKCASMGVIRGDEIGTRQLYRALMRRLIHLGRPYLTH